MIYLLQRFIIIIATISASGAHKNIQFSFSELMHNVTSIEVKVLERRRESKSRIWACFASVFVENRYSSQECDVKYEPARKAC